MTYLEFKRSASVFFKDLKKGKWLVPALFLFSFVALIFINKLFSDKSSTGNEVKVQGSNIAEANGNNSTAVVNTIYQPIKLEYQATINPYYDSLNRFYRAKFVFYLYHSPDQKITAKISTSLFDCPEIIYHPDDSNWDNAVSTYDARPLSISPEISCKSKNPILDNGKLFKLEIIK